MSPTRRALIASGLVAVVAPAAWGQGGSAPATIAVADAHAMARRREAILVDIRTPDEWRTTGVPESGHAITMHQDGRTFLAALDAATGGDRGKPVILICATGNRSSMLQAHLRRAGYSSVLDAGEGMQGGRRGTGWIRSGLPVRPATSGATPKLD